MLPFWVAQAWAWGGSNSGSDSSTTSSVFGNSLGRDWLSDSKGISIKLEGCLWGYVEDNESAYCMEDSSEDGTTYWYQMANCRRAQAVFSVYANPSSSNAACNAGNFKESFVTKSGLSEFIYYLKSYDSNNPFGSANDDNGDGSYSDDNNLPMCAQVNGNYVGVGCASDGTFSLQIFSDQHCLVPTGSTYDNLKSVNRKLKNYRNCASAYSYGDDSESSLVYNLVSNAESCSSLDSSLCMDNSAMADRRSYSKGRVSRNRGFSQSQSWLTKAKYVAGGILLLAAFVMFTGILFTNRRRRRALMQRKYRQSRRGGEDRSRRSSKSGRSKSKGRSVSRSKSARREKGDPVGVFT